MKRRERTRHLIELGGLIVKAKLDDLTHDDRTVLYGALLTLAISLNSPDGAGAIELWRRRGKHAFEDEAEEAKHNAAKPGDAHQRYERRTHDRAGHQNAQTDAGPSDTPQAPDLPAHR